MGSCPFCQCGNLYGKLERVPVEWEGRTGTVTMEHSECSMCGSEIVDDWQSKRNKDAVMAFRNQANG